MIKAVGSIISQAKAMFPKASEFVSRHGTSGLFLYQGWKGNKTAKRDQFNSIHFNRLANPGQTMSEHNLFKNRNEYERLKYERTIKK